MACLYYTCNMGRDFEHKPSLLVNEQQLGIGEINLAQL